MSTKILSTAVLTCILLGAANVAHAQRYEKLYTYGGGPGDGARPYAGMIQNADGMFYWTTSEGGAHLCGAVFVAGGEVGVTILHSFTPDEGCNPTAGLLLANDGFFYGTASTGGLHGGGTLFRMSALGEVTVLHHFDAANALDGATPYFGVIQASDGLLYGTTTAGGAYGFGTVYRADTNGAITILHSFGETTSDGLNPSSPLIQAADGTFYGTTYGGGNPNPPGCDPCDRIAGGTVYQMTVSGNVGSIFNRFNFMVGGSSGDSPFGGLIQTGPTTFYGTTSSAEGLFSGSDWHAGTIFELDTSNDFGGLYTIHAFPYDFSEGAAPFGTLIRAGDGHLYGTTGGLGETPSGVFRFRLDNSGQLDVLHIFEPDSGDGYGPAAPLFEGLDGNLYGSTTGTIPFFGNGSAGFGTIFGLLMDLSGVVRQDQAITFGPLANKAVGDPDFFVGATSSSGLRVWFTASGSCTVSGAKVHLTGAGSCTITASQGGNAYYHAALSVPQSFTIVEPTPALTFSLSLASVTGGTNATGTVTLTSPAPSGGAVVTLSSSNAAAASVPATITIPKGKTAKTFAITTSAVASATPVSISASYGGTTTPASLTVNPPALQGITLMPSAVKGGTSSTARITLTGPAPAGGLLVLMTSSNTSAAAVTNVTVPAGSSSVSVAIATFKVNAATAVTITATSGGVSKSATLTVKK
jgi:uncharacterized repeat protein (TIGR03803 family)